MTLSTEGQTPPPKLLGTASIKIRIALGSGLLLALGVALAPRAAPTPLGASQERTAPLLEQQVQAREAVQPFRALQDAADRVTGRGVAIPSEPLAASIDDFSEPADETTASGFGVFVSDVHVLTHADAVNGRQATPVITADGRRLTAKTVAHEPGTGLVLLQTEPSGAILEPIATVAPARGMLAVAAGRASQRDITVPVFVTSVAGDRFSLGGLSGSVAPGMPVYTLDGQLIAIASGNARGDAYSIRAAVDRLMTRVASGVAPASFGIGFQPLDGLLRRVYGDGGVLINHIVEDGPADRAGIRVGDALVAVEDTEIDAIATAVKLLSAHPIASPARLRIRRAGRDRVVEATPTPSYEVEARARETSDGVEGAVQARMLWPRTVLDGAAIPSAAWVLAINGRTTVSRAQAQRDLLRARGVVSVLLRHGDTRFFAAIEQQR